MSHGMYETDTLPGDTQTNIAEKKVLVKVIRLKRGRHKLIFIDIMQRAFPCKLRRQTIYRRNRKGKQE